MNSNGNRIYTRKGDLGQTGLIGNKRVSKANLRVEAYGSIDELNAMIGFARDNLDDKTIELKPILLNIQQELFDIGCEIATPGMLKRKESAAAVSKHVGVFEDLCDRYSEDLSELNSFILPGGSRLSSSLHLARTVCRRAERAFVRFVERPRLKNRELDDSIIKYLNRLGDLLFVLSRWTLHKQGISEILWAKS